MNNHEPPMKMRSEHRLLLSNFSQLSTHSVHIVTKSHDFGAKSGNLALDMLEAVIHPPKLFDDKLLKPSGIPKFLHHELLELPVRLELSHHDFLELPVRL